jgi:cell division septation protein DedD
MTAGGSRHRFELTRLEIAGLIVSSAASLFIVFMLGVYAGRSLGARDLADEERIVRLPVAPGVEEAPVRDDALTFDDTLAGGDRGSARAPAAPLAARAPGDARVPVEVQAPARERALAPAVPALAARAADEDTLQPPEEKPALATGGGSAPQAGHLATRTGASVADTSDANATGSKVPGSGSGAGVHTAAPRVAVALAPAPEAGSASPFASGVWSVQVTATREPQAADDMVRRLRSKGYDAYVVKTRRQGSTFYRVRVGHYPAMERASQMVSRLRREPGVPEAFVASD